MARHRVLVEQLVAWQGLDLARCHLPPTTTHRQTVGEWSQMDPPEQCSAVTAIGAKLCVTGPLLIWGKTPDPGSPYLNRHSHRLLSVPRYL